MPQTVTQTSLDRSEQAKFAALADRWWDADGPMAPLHKLAPARLGYLKMQLCGHFARDPGGLRPLAGLRVLDVGCGAGLVCEPLARLGAQMTGLDAAPENVAAARAHAAACGLDIDYQAMTAEDFLAAHPRTRFDAVVSLEVVEHVASVSTYLEAIAGLLKPEGLFLFSTPNRTAASFLSVIIGAEYLLRWLPRGTHDWRRFLTPAAFEAALNASGLTLTDLRGLTYLPLRDRFIVNDDLSVNYIGAAVPAHAPGR